MTVTAHLDPPAVSVDPGGEQHVTVHIRNSGNIVEAYRLDVVGAASEWAVLEPTTLSLYPGSTETAVLTFRPPRSPQLTADELPYAVRVLPTERPDGVTVPEGTVRVLPFHELDAELLPKSAEGRLRARSQIGIGNRGNTSASVVLTATDPADRLQHTIKPGTLTIPPGDRVYLDLTVRAKKRLWRGKAKPHPFEIQLTSGDGEDEKPSGTPTVLPGTYEQLPLLPGWLFALTAALAALVALWFALVRPTVQSAARQSVDAQVKQAVQEAVNPQSAQPPAPPNPAAGGASPTPGAHAAGGGTGGGTGPGAADTAGGTGSVQAQFSKRLDVTVKPGDRGEADFKAPDDRLLLITDLVSYAPQGDEGTLTVSVDGKEVVSLALENFRDHDRPWVTPIQAPPKSSVVLSVTCRKPGTPPDEPAPTACVESLVVSGSTVAPAPPAPASSPH